MIDNEIVEAKAYYKYGIDCDTFSEPVLSYAKAAVIALEKQIQKKPTEVKEAHQVFKYVCQSCGCRFIHKVYGEWVAGSRDNHCSVCGQALDWSDFE